MSRNKLFWVAGFVVLTTVVAGISPSPAKEERRTIYMSAVEYKGGANVADEPYPPAAAEGTLPLAPLGGGYRLKPADDTGRWEVESYRWEPGFLAVNVGERVTLEIVGINGASHDAVLVSPSGKTTALVVTRGRMTRLRFKASEAGIWQLVCHTHPPGMTAEILAVG